MADTTVFNFDFDFSGLEFGGLFVSVGNELSVQFHGSHGVDLGDSEIVGSRHNYFVWFEEGGIFLIKRIKFGEQKK